MSLATAEDRAAGPARWRGRVDLPDALLVRYLEARDGPLRSGWRRHSEHGKCRYMELYQDSACPWCEAEDRRDRGDRLRLTA
jgi:hypothetical protein